jgi:hypothetical protein
MTLIAPVIDHSVFTLAKFRMAAHCEAHPKQALSGVFHLLKHTR